MATPVSKVQEIPLQSSESGALTPASLEETEITPVSLSIRSSDDLKIMLGDVPNGQGVNITHVVEEGMAWRSGLRAGDHILAVDDQAFNQAKLLQRRLSRAEAPYVLVVKPANPANNLLAKPASLEKGPRNAAHTAVFMEAEDLDFRYKEDRRDIVVTHVGPRSAKLGVMVGDMVFAVQGQYLKKGTTIAELDQSLDETPPPITIQFNGEGATASDSLQVKVSGTVTNPRELKTVEEPCEDTHPDGRSMKLPPLQDNYNVEDPLQYTATSLQERNKQLYWDVVVGNPNEKDIGPPMPVENLKFSQLADLHDTNYNDVEDNPNAKEPSTAGPDPELEIITAMSTSKHIEAGKELKLQTFVKNAARYAWEHTPTPDAPDDDSEWKLLRLDSPDEGMLTSNFKIDVVRVTDGGTYRVIAFDKSMRHSVAQKCNITIEAPKIGNQTMFGENEHQLFQCIDAMNADPNFFLQKNALRLPDHDCQIPFEFCVGAQLQFCSPPCAVDVKCRHLIRDCYVKHYDSRLVFSECFYEKVSRPHEIDVSHDSSLRSLEVDQASPEAIGFKPEKTVYDIWLSPHTGTIRLRAVVAIGGRVNIRDCSTPLPAPERSDAELVTSGEWSMPTAIPTDMGDESSLCLDVTAQDQETTTTYELRVHVGQLTTAEVVAELHLPELMYGFEHDKLYYPDVDAGDRTRLQIVVSEKESIKQFRLMTRVNLAPERETQVVEILPGRNLIQVALQAPNGDRSPIYSVFVTRNTPSADYSDVADRLLTHIAVNASAALGGAALALSPPFQPHRLIYETTFVPYDCENVTLVATATAPTTTMSINGIAYRPGEVSPPQPLLPGFNALEIQALAADGSELLYRVFIERQERTVVSVDSPAVVSKLAKLSLYTSTSSSSEATPLRTDMLNMHHRLGADVEYVFVVPVTESKHATVEVRGNAVHNGHQAVLVKPPVRYRLNPGPNRFDITTHLAGSNVTTEYQLILEKPVMTYRGSEISTLEALYTNANPDDVLTTLPSTDQTAGHLVPPFDPTVTDYRLKVLAETPYLLIWTDASDPHALVMVNQQSIGPDDTSLPIRIHKREPTPIVVEVTAPDGILAHNTSYTIMASPADDSASLKRWPYYYCQTVTDTVKCDVQRGDVLDHRVRITNATDGFDEEYRVLFPRGFFFMHWPIPTESADGGGPTINVTEVDGTIREVKPGGATEGPWVQLENGVGVVVVELLSEDRANRRRVRVRFHEDETMGYGLYSLGLFYHTGSPSRYWESDNLLDSGFTELRLDNPFNVQNRYYKVNVPYNAKTITLRVQVSDDMQTDLRIKPADPTKECLRPQLHRNFLAESTGVLTYYVHIGVVMNCDSEEHPLPPGPTALQIEAIQRQSTDGTITRTTYTLVLDLDFPPPMKLIRETAGHRDLSHDARLRRLYTIEGQPKAGLAGSCDKVDCDWHRIPEEYMHPVFRPEDNRREQRFDLVIGPRVTHLYIVLQSQAFHTAASSETRTNPYLVFDGESVSWPSGELEVKRMVEIKTAGKRQIDIVTTAEDTKTAVTYTLAVDKAGSAALKLVSFGVGKNYLRLLFSQPVSADSIETGSLTVRSAIPPHDTMSLESTDSRKKTYGEEAVQVTCAQKLIGSVSTCFEQVEHVFIRLTSKEARRLEALATHELELVAHSSLVVGEGARLQETLSDQFVVPLTRRMPRLRRWAALLDSRALLLFEFDAAVDATSFDISKLTFAGVGGNTVSLSSSELRLIERLELPELKTMLGKMGLSASASVMDKGPGSWGVLSVGTPTADAEDDLYFSVASPNVVALHIRSDVKGDRFNDALALRDKLRRAARSDCMENGHALSLKEMADLLHSYKNMDADGSWVVSCKEMEAALLGRGVLAGNAQFVTDVYCEDNQVTYDNFASGVMLNYIPVAADHADTVNAKITKLRRALIGDPDGQRTDAPTKVPALSGMVGVVQLIYELLGKELYVPQSPLVFAIEAEFWRLSMDPAYNRERGGYDTKCPIGFVKPDKWVAGVSAVPSRVLAAVIRKGVLPVDDLEARFAQHFAKFLSFATMVYGRTAKDPRKVTGTDIKNLLEVVLPGVDLGDQLTQQTVPFMVSFGADAERVTKFLTKKILIEPPAANLNFQTDIVPLFESRFTSDTGDSQVQLLNKRDAHFRAVQFVDVVHANSGSALTAYADDKANALCTGALAGCKEYIDQVPGKDGMTCTRYKGLTDGSQCTPTTIFSKYDTPTFTPSSSCCDCQAKSVLASEVVWKRRRVMREKAYEAVDIKHAYFVKLLQHSGLLDPAAVDFVQKIAEKTALREAGATDQRMATYSVLKSLSDSQILPLTLMFEFIHQAYQRQGAFIKFEDMEYAQALQRHEMPCEVIHLNKGGAALAAQCDSSKTPDGRRNADNCPVACGVVGDTNTLPLNFDYDVVNMDETLTQLDYVDNDGNHRVDDPTWRARLTDGGDIVTCHTLRKLRTCDVEIANKAEIPLRCPYTCPRTNTFVFSEPIETKDIKRYALCHDSRWEYELSGDLDDRYYLCPRDTDCGNGDNNKHCRFTCGLCNGDEPLAHTTAEFALRGLTRLLSAHPQKIHEQWSSKLRISPDKLVIVGPEMKEFEDVEVVHFTVLFLEDVSITTVKPSGVACEDITYGIQHCEIVQVGETTKIEARPPQRRVIGCNAATVLQTFLDKAEIKYGTHRLSDSKFTVGGVTRSFDAFVTHAVEEYARKTWSKEFYHDLRKEYKKTCQPHVEAALEAALKVNSYVVKQRDTMQASFETIAGEGKTELHTFLVQDRLKTRLSLREFHAQLIASSLSTQGKFQLTDFAVMVVRHLLPAAFSRTGTGETRCQPGSGELTVQFPLTLVQDNQTSGVRPSSPEGDLSRAVITITSDTTLGCDCLKMRSQDGYHKELEARQVSDFTCVRGSKSASCKLLTTFVDDNSEPVCEVDPATCMPGGMGGVTVQSLLDARSDKAMREHLDEWCTGRSSGDDQVSCLHGQGVCAGLKDSTDFTCLPTPRILTQKGTTVADAQGLAQMTATVTVTTTAEATVCQWVVLGDASECPFDKRLEDEPSLQADTCVVVREPGVYPSSTTPTRGDGLTCVWEKDTNVCKLSIERDNLEGSKVAAFARVGMHHVLTDKYNAGTTNCGNPIMVHLEDPMQQLQVSER